MLDNRSMISLGLREGQELVIIEGIFKHDSCAIYLAYNNKFIGGYL